MGATSVKMKKMKTDDLRDVVKAVRKSLMMDAEVLCEHWREYDDVKACLLSFEKYYFRNGSYASLSMMFVESGDVQTVDCIGSGGGEGLLNISWGANKNFAKRGYEELKIQGFEEDKGELS